MDFTIYGHLISLLRRPLLVSLSSQTGLLVACYQGYVDVVIALSRCPHLDVNWQDSEGNTALITATQAGKSGRTRSGVSGASRGQAGGCRRAKPRPACKQALLLFVCLFVLSRPHNNHQLPAQLLSWAGHREEELPRLHCPDEGRHAGPRGVRTLAHDGRYRNRH